MSPARCRRGGRIGCRRRRPPWTDRPLPVPGLRASSDNDAVTASGPTIAQRRIARKVFPPIKWMFSLSRDAALGGKAEVASRGRPDIASRRRGPTSGRHSSIPAAYWRG